MGDELSIRKERLKAIENGKGVQYILNKAYEILGNPALIFDMEYKLIASPDGASSDDPIWNEFMVYGRLGNETIEFFKNESFIDSVANSTKFDGVTYLLSDKLKYDRIFGQIYNKNRMPVADLCAVACEKPFDYDTPELTRIVCDILSKELSQSEYYQDYGQAYQETIIKKLIEGSIEDKGVYSGHVANLDDGLETNISLAVVDISKNNRSLDQIVYFRDLFKQIQNKYKYYIYSDYIVALTSSMNNVRLGNKEDVNLCKIFKEYNMFVGLSKSFENLFELQKHYDEAMEAMQYGMKANSGHQVFVYDERVILPFDVYRVLSKE